MTAIPHLRANTNMRLSQVLQAAVILSWDQLIHPGTPGSIHIEYGTGMSGTVDFVKVLSSTTRGHWQLVCECWASSEWGHSPGITFGDIPCPRQFAQAVVTLMQHQAEFDGVGGVSSGGIIQVSSPTAEERTHASSYLGEVFDHLGYAPSERGMVA